MSIVDPVKVPLQVRQNLLAGRFVRVLFPTLTTELSILLSTVLTLRLAAHAFGANGFGEYAVAKRAYTVLTFTILLGLGISVARYVGMNSSEERRREREEFFLSAIGISIVALIFFSVVPLLLPGQFTRVLFGNASYSNYALPLWITVVGLYFQTLTYSYLRGELRMGPANIFRLLTNALIPPLAVVFASNNPAMSIMLLGIGWTVISLLFGTLIVRRFDLTRFELHAIFDKVGTLLRYGVPRVPGEFALFGLFAVPTIMLSHTEGVVSAGYFSFGVSLLQVVGASFASLGIILLPYISRLFASEQYRVIQRTVIGLSSVSFVIALIMALTLQYWLNQFVLMLMGDEFIAAVPDTRWLIWGVLPYVIYLVLRNPLDAIANWPYNSINVTSGLVLLLGLAYLASNFVSAQLAAFFALALIGCLSVASWTRVVRGFPALSAPISNIDSIRGDLQHERP